MIFRACLAYLLLCYWFVWSEEEISTTYEQLYKNGMQAYLENRWKDCIEYIERSLYAYQNYRAIILHCRYRCQSSIENKLEKTEIKEMFNFYELIVTNAHCLMKCEKTRLKNRQIDKEVDSDFQSKMPYDYLQLCYFKIDKLENAASCSYTFLVHNPGHEVMQNNLRYYVGLPGVNLQNVKYLEPKNYQEFYIKGAHSYTEKNFKEVIEWMEQALQEYLNAEEECRLFCEGPMNSPVDTDFIVSVANHFTFTLRCKLECPLKLSLIHGQMHQNLFSSHYHYLQFAYYKTQQFKKTCEAVASYLLFHPNDTVMLDNKHFYEKLEEVEANWFIPRQEAVKYYNKVKQERDLLQYIEQAFQFNDINNQSYTSFVQPLLPPPSNANNVINIEKIAKNANKPEEILKWEKSNGISIIMKDKDLNGSLRFAADGLATEEECEKMISLASEGGLHGDGYNGKQSPHTEYEMFEGLTVARAAILAQKGLLNAVSSQIFLNISEKARNYVEMYFQLDSYLYFAYTHLVCRTALPDSPGLRTDLSHPVHADNCVLVADGQCLKQRPAYTWRDYSAIVYLNEDFEGGNFIFAKDKNTVQATVRPKCGRMVAFSAGKENLHGVQAVQKGRRCALAMWYTLDPKHKERERDFAEHILADLVRKKENAKTEEKSKSDKIKISLPTDLDKSDLHSSESSNLEKKSTLINHSEEQNESSKDHLHPEL